MLNYHAVSTLPGAGLPSFETLAKLAPLPVEGRPVADVMDDLNRAIKQTGIEFGENEFTALRYMSDQPEKFENFRWIDCTAVRGSNEGYYIHVSLVPRRHDLEPSRLVATAKTWDWASALAIAAAATRFLND